MAMRRGVFGACFALAACAVLAACAPVSGANVGSASVTVAGKLIVEGGASPCGWRVLVTRKIAPVLPTGPGGRPIGAALAEDGTFVSSYSGREVVYVCPYIGGKLAAESVVPLLPTKERAEAREVTIKVKPPREKVEFKLSNTQKKPLNSGIRVHIYNTYGEITPNGGVAPDKDGVVSLAVVPCAKYDLWIEPVPLQGTEESKPIAAAAFRDLEVKPGPGTQRFTLAVPPAGEVRGRLVCEDGKTPAAGYVVALESGTLPAPGSDPATWPAAYAHGALSCYTQTVVGGDGTFVLRGVLPGTHWLDVREPGRREARFTIPEVEVKPDKVTDLGTVYVPPNRWKYLFSGRSLAGWKESRFYGQQPVRIENDRVVLPRGADLTGITWTRDIPRIDYEVSLQAMRVDGYDFFCGLTFPVEDSYCTLILGGWGGCVVGLSSINGADASENETSQWITFDLKRWYRVRLRVTKTKIEAWLDADKIIDVSIEGKQISIRFEVEPSRPFGVATWCTTGAIRDIRLKKL